MKPIGIVGDERTQDKPIGGECREVHCPASAATSAFTFFWRHCGKGAINQ